MTKDQIIRRGEAAAQMLNSDLFAELTKAIDKKCFEDWVNSNPAHADAREGLYRLVQCHADYARLLNSWKSEAQVELHNIERAKRDAGSTQL